MIPDRRCVLEESQYLQAESDRRILKTYAPDHILMPRETCTGTMAPFNSKNMCRNSLLTTVTFLSAVSTRALDVSDRCGSENARGPVEFHHRMCDSIEDVVRATVVHCDNYQP